MCTVITLQRPGYAWPLLLAANRDERLDRSWNAPAAHWPDYPDAVGGRDRSGGGTWMAVGRSGVVAAVLNRRGSLGPMPGKTSRGVLPLLASRHGSARAAAAAIAALDGRAFRSFNLVAADRSSVWFVRNDDGGELAVSELPSGLHMVTAHDPDDDTSPRIARHRRHFQAAAWPEPPDWGAWPALLADAAPPRDAALTVPPVDGFGTVCSSLLAVSAAGEVSWCFAAGPAGQARFHRVQLPAAAAGGGGAHRLL